MCGHQKADSALDGEGLLRKAAQCSNSSIHGHTRMGVQSGLEYPRPSPKSRSLELVDHESRDERLFSPRLVPAGWARVARPEVGLEDDRARGERHRAELRRPLAGLPEGHPRIA